MDCINKSSMANKEPKPEEESDVTGDEEIKPLKRVTKWLLPQNLDHMTLIGKDVLAVAHDLYIQFLNFRTGLETVYVADGKENGDGVDAISGFKSNMFVFAEKVQNPRIFIMNYPHFNILGELKDPDVNRYKGLCLIEGEMVAAFSGFPNYIFTVWSWRTGERLLVMPTGIIRRQQIFSPSRSHTMVCQCYGQGLIVWEIAPCFRKTFVMRRAKDAAGRWDVAEAPYVAAAFTNEGHLYVLDSDCKFYSAATDNVKMHTKLEWELDDLKGESKPLMCALGNGFLLYCSDGAIRWLKLRDGKKWFLKWTYVLEEEEEVVRLVGSAGAENAVAWTRSGRIYRISPPAPPPAAVLAAATCAGAAASKKTTAFTIRGRAPKSRALRAAAAAAAEKEAAAETAADAAQLAAEAAVRAAEEADPDIVLFNYKQRNIKKLKLIAPDFKHLVTMNFTGELCIYEVLSAKLVLRRQLSGTDPEFQTSPMEPVLAVIAALGENYGLSLMLWDEKTPDIKITSSVCLTHQVVDRAVFSPTSRHIIATAMSAGHMFIYKVTVELELVFVRYVEFGRGLVDCFLMQVGDSMKALALVLFSDKFLLGERIMGINADTGKDNKLTGKMKGPYYRLQPLAVKDTAIAIAHLSREYHILKMAEKGGLIMIKMGAIIDSGHDLRHFSAVRGLNALVTFGAEGAVILRRPKENPEYDYKFPVSHRFDSGVRIVAIDNENKFIAHLAKNGTAGITNLHQRPELICNIHHQPLDPEFFKNDKQIITVFDVNQKNYLDLLEEKLVREEAILYKKEREDVVSQFKEVQSVLVALLEENINERPLHQLSLSEFNLHMEFKKERLKQAEIERLKIKLETEERIRAQDKVTAWIKEKCWDTMTTPRVKLYAIFSHYEVENYPVWPSQRDEWPELLQTAGLRALEMENDADVFKPWDETPLLRKPETSRTITSRKLLSVTDVSKSQDLFATVTSSEIHRDAVEVEEEPQGDTYVLSGTSTHKYITIPPFQIPQTLAISFLQMNFQQEITKLNVQNMRIWFNKKFDELMSAKRRECQLVGERNARLRFILSELNKLSDLRGSFHHIMIQIKDPEWRQEEQPIKLTKVEVTECSISPYTSQILVVPPELGPKDDFKERALMEMMDGVLEKLWHEEIKKPIPKPQCMLDKEPEHWNEEDLRKVYEYEAKVRFREEEREKYRRMLHAEYAKLSATLNENIVKFNTKVKDMWLTKLKVESVIGQENLNLMRLRRTNLDRTEADEQLDVVRSQIGLSEADVEHLQAELAQVQEQFTLCQQTYDSLSSKDRHMERSFKNNFSDFSPIVVDQCFKFFKKRPKWIERATMIPPVLNELAAAIGSNTRPPLLHPDCLDYLKGVEQLDQISNMPPVLDETLWATMCRLRRLRIENEIHIRAMVAESAIVEHASQTWSKALDSRRKHLQECTKRVSEHRKHVFDQAVNRTIQLVLPAGQVEIASTARMEDFEDAALLPREDVEEINRLIKKVGEMKLKLLRRQIEFRKLILTKEWEHAQMKMKLRHMQQELYSYTRLKVPKELQRFLKNLEQGQTDEDDYKLLEKEMAATKMLIERVLEQSARVAEELQVKISTVDSASKDLDHLLEKLIIRVSEKRLNEDLLEPIRIRKVFRKRMETLVARSMLIRQVQANHSRIILLQTELELLRLRTYPTLSSFVCIC